MNDVDHNNPDNEFAQPPIGATRVPQTVVIDMFENVEVTGGGCPDLCASCGWVSDEHETGNEKRGSMREVTEQQIVDILNKILEDTGVRVRDILAPFVTTNVNIDPLWTKSFAKLAKLLWQFTEKRSPFAPKGFRDLDRSRLVCISHGLTVKQDMDENWISQGNQEDRLMEIVDLMKEGKIPLFVLSLDVAKQMAGLGAKNLIIDMARMKEKKERISKKIELMKQLKKALEELDATPEEEKENKKAQIKKLFDKLETCETADIIHHAQFIETVDREIENIDNSSRTLEDRKKEEGQQETESGSEDTTNIPESKISKRLRSLAKRRAVLVEKATKADRAKRITERELDGIKNEISQSLENGPISTTFLTTRLSKMAEAEDDNNEKLAKIPDQINTTVEETNAQGYARTLYLLIPAIEKGIRVTVSLQGDKNDNRTNVVRMGRAVKTYNRALEILKEMLEKDYPGEGADRLRELRTRLHQNQIYYVRAGRASTVLGITDDDRQCNIIPDPEFAAYAENAAPTRVNRAKITNNGRILVQPIKPGRTYNETARKDPGAWTPINLGTAESLKAVADRKIDSYKRLAKPRIINTNATTTAEDDNENFTSINAVEFIDSDRLFKIWPLNKVDSDVQKERIRYALKYLLWEIEEEKTEISSAEELRKLLIQILVRPEIAETYRRKSDDSETFNDARKRMAEEITGYFKSTVQNDSANDKILAEKSASILAVRTLLAEEMRVEIKLPGDYSEEDDDLGGDPTD
jgi:hypothetical protein